MITSLQNERVKLAHGLQTQLKTRRKEGKIVLEGARLVLDAMQRGGIRPDYVLYEPERGDAGVIDLLERQRAPMFPVSVEVMQHVADTEQPQGIVGIFPMPAATLPVALRRVMILDAIRDPGNLGTILRTGAAAGVDAVLLAPGCVDAYNPKVLRSAMGAHFRVPVVEQAWERIGAACHDTRVYLADMEGDATYDAVDWSSPWSLIIGSEAHGASPQAEALAETKVYIPMASNAESLNAAVAAGVLLFEANRQTKL